MNENLAIAVYNDSYNAILLHMTGYINYRNDHPVIHIGTSLTRLDFGFSSQDG
jgi:hypothetical protein